MNSSVINTTSDYPLHSPVTRVQRVVQLCLTYPYHAPGLSAQTRHGDNRHSCRFPVRSVFSSSAFLQRHPTLFLIAIALFPSLLQYPVEYFATINLPGQHRLVSSVLDFQRLFRCFLPGQHIGKMVCMPLVVDVPE